MGKYYEKIFKKIAEKEEELGRKLTEEEQTEIKIRVMDELWIEAGKELAKDEPQPK